jgi:hypothetical protein
VVADAWPSLPEAIRLMSEIDTPIPKWPME